MLWESVAEPCEMCEYRSESDQCCENCDRHPCMDKENINRRNENDISLYEKPSPEHNFRHSLSPFRCPLQRAVVRRPLQDYDPNSQDSGYGASYTNDGAHFSQFARSLGVTPRADFSPMKSPSFGGLDPMDAEFLEFSEPNDENSLLPTDFNKLISGSLSYSMRATSLALGNDHPIRPILQRSSSLTVDGTTPNSTRLRSSLFNSEADTEFRPFKRPEPPCEMHSPVFNKRSKVIEENAQLPVVSPKQRPALRRSMSATEESIKVALQRSSTEPDLIGDFSKMFCLPLTLGRHQDLKSITPSTLAMVMRGEFAEPLASYKVIDCRYPYEFEGGHISGAVNVYTKEQVLKELLDARNAPAVDGNASRRNILVFHCEFSSERGPNLYRFLRKQDRLRNKDTYPALHYPEVYLLDGGYKNFYEQYAYLCFPESYKPMLHPEHQRDLRHFRAKSKTWNGDRYKQQRFQPTLESNNSPYS